VKLLNYESGSEGSEEEVEDGQLTELLDNLTSASYDKNYPEAIRYYLILREMLKSATYASLLHKPQIKVTT
jgi:hypothetical protein